jgi:hypothetical protein
MEIEVNNTKFGIRLGFGIVMKIQSLLSASITPENAKRLETLQDTDSMDDVPEDLQATVQNNILMMPEVLKLTLKSVNGKPLSNIDAYVDETLNPQSGIELFEKVLGHINEMMVPKVSGSESTE